MKKILTFTLALILLLNLTLITDSTVYAKGKRFHDLKTTDWFYETVDVLTSQGLIDGYPDGTFRPNDSILVSEFITLVVRIKDKSVKNGTLIWYKPYVDRAKELGLVLDGEFDTYERNITRGEMAKIIYRALSSEEQVSSDKDLEKYKDQIKDFNTIPLNLKTYILKSYATGIMAGYPDGTFKPQNDANRAEAATMIRRLIDKNFRQIPKLVQKHEKLVVNGENLTVTNKEVIDPYYKIMEIMNNSNGYIREYKADNNNLIDIYYLPKKDSYLHEYYMNVLVYYNPQDELEKNYPYFIAVKILNEDTKKILEETLKVLYPKTYKSIYDYFVDLYENGPVENTGLEKEGKQENRRYKIYNRGYTGVEIEIGRLEN
ncbi:S-layer homology domain-containing protein [Caloranaerobacter azorensis DSM 13643]|uniref:S-layer homology domain-containing protein n=1 Tax=Caloranaerobacter azorensis DSM 13643 TaxID=1121264 RepID=A0A1M5V0L2_9FIRM|nr:S-layer homology domain-containing protein [Caloranaerobacter azorensis]SHH68802.1 S-layer homology domain-containing protein [Caloranaerobacter azorensis DSM 13643]